MRRWALRGLLALLVGLGLLAGGAFGWRAVARHQVAQAVAIDPAKGIDEAGFVRINGVLQWVTIRGQDRTRPVVLVLHGGPGMAQSFLLPQVRPLERDYVVAQWDQRGAGKTLTQAGGVVDPALDMATMVRDGVAVTDYVRGRLHRDKIVLLGFSWGSELGVTMVQARPDLYLAYVGTGQAAGTQAQSDPLVYADLVAQARAAHDAKTLAAFAAAGPPPWSPAASQAMWRSSAPYRAPDLSYWGGVETALTAPHWSLGDVMGLSKGRGALKQTKLEKEIWAADPSKASHAFAVPVLIIQGARDLTTPTALARTWFDQVQAPAKVLRVIPGAGHQAMLTHDAAFTDILDEALPTFGVGAPAGRWR